jgi:trehalose synthase-fused probable maltokinase
VLAEAVARLDGAALGAARWFAGKSEQVAAVRLLAELRPDPAGAALAVIEVAGAGGGADAYALPALIGADGLLAEAPADDPLWEALARVALESGRVAGAGCVLAGSAGPARAVAGAGVRPLGADQSHTTLVLGERIALKCYRRLEWGEHPELELTRRLTEAGVAGVPAVHGSATIAVAGRGSAALLLAQDYVAGAEDGWALAERELDAALDRGRPAGAAAAWAPAAGAAVAAVHAALAADGRPATPAEVAAWRAAAGAAVEHALAVLPGSARAELAAARPRLEEAVAQLAAAPPPLACRIHGDLHLGQLLLRDGRVWIVDFEGEPARPLAERRAPHAALRDLATLLRSADNAAHWVLTRRHAAGLPADPAVAVAWIAAVRAGLRAGYADGLAAAGAPFAIDDRVVRALEADKAVDELLYAVRFLPAWLDTARAALRAFPAGP